MHRSPLPRACALLVVAIAVVTPTVLTAQSIDRILNQRFGWRNIGPATMMGRISCIDALDEDYRTVLIGSASGGVFKSSNGGITWTPIFESYGSQSIGDVAFFQPNPDIIWVGTGEATNRNSVGWGDGIYKSTDGGKTFRNVGLRETHQISEILPHPTDPDVVYVAAIGHLWGYSGDRGLFKTTDGGENWTKLTDGLPDDGRTGATVVTMHPDDPDVLYVGMYERMRSAYHMQSGGPNGGLFKSTDGGSSWRKLTDGLPTGETGQIDISIYRRDASVIWAYVEASDELPDDLSVPGPGIYKSIDAGDSWEYMLRHNSRPYYHGRIRVNPANSDWVYVVSREFYHSSDGGATWEGGRPWRGGGGDDHDMWIDPNDEGIFYHATDQGAYLSVDGGQSLLSFNNMAIGQYYAIGVDMRDPYWVYGGLQDNGGWAIPSRTREPQGILNDHATVVNGGDGFHMQIDPTDWRTVYTTAHVGYFGRQNMETFEHVFITPTPATTVNFADHYDPNYGESQTNYSINPQERWLWGDIPNRTINGSILPPQFRWNWNAPLVMSPVNPHTLYVGSNYLFKSVDRGETWRIISPDLTNNDPATRNSTNSGGLTKDATGAENHHTIYTIDESPLNSAVVWVGTDDGNVQVTRDGGVSWTNVRAAIPGLPQGIWTSRVEASHFDDAVAYATFDGHWWDDTAPYVYRTRDYGVSWEDISGNIPRANPGNSVYTIVEDFVNPDLLFVGTEFGVFVTIDGGDTWTRFMEGLPPVAVHDLVIHPRDRDLVAGTHGRSIWIADDISPLQLLSERVLASDLHVFENPIATKWLNQSKGRIQNHFKFRGQNPDRGAAINFYVRAEPADSVTVIVEDVLASRTRVLMTKAQRGINTVRWDFEFEPTSEALAAHRNELERILGVTRERTSSTRNTDHLEQMQKDLLARQRYPSMYEDAAYPNTHDARRLLLDHLGHIEDRLRSANSTREMFRVREQLLAFSQVIGDEAFFGFYGEELRPATAPAGTYRVTVTAGDATATGTVTVREDPLKRD